MNWKGWVLLLIAAMFLLSGAFSADGTGIFSIVPGGGKEGELRDKPVWHTERLDVQTPAYLNASTFGGSITVNAHELDEIVVRIHVKKRRSYLKAGEDAPVRISVTETPNGLEISAEPERNGLFRSGSSISVSYDILVPAATEVRANTSGGSLSAYDIAKSVTLITSGGPVTVERVDGDVLARTSGGPINARNITGDLTTRTSGGGIRISNATGNISARTSGGPIRLERVTGAIEAHTSGGSIDAHVLYLEDHLTLNTSGGSIKAILPRDLGMDIRASGSSVRNRLDDLTGDITSNSIRGSVHGGGIPVELRTTGGSVRIEYRE